MRALADITKEALELPSVQRFTLARILLDVSELGDDSIPAFEEAWDQEICKRIDSIHDGSAKFRSSTEVLLELDRRFPG